MRERKDGKKFKCEAIRELRIKVKIVVFKNVLHLHGEQNEAAQICRAVHIK